jgi:hypothetical protein
MERHHTRSNDSISVLVTCLIQTGFREADRALTNIYGVGLRPWRRQEARLPYERSVPYR